MLNHDLVKKKYKKYKEINYIFIYILKKNIGKRIQEKK